MRVVAGPDEGARLALTDSERDYRIGRSRDADLVLKDTLTSRFHALVRRQGGHWQVHDNGSKRGTLLHDEKLSDTPQQWPRDMLLKVGDTTIALLDPLPAARAEALAAPDLPMRPEEHQQPAPGRPSQPSRSPAQPAPTHPDEDGDAAAAAEDTAEDARTPPTPASANAIEALRDPKGAGYVSIDLLVVLVSLGVIGISMAALWWVLG